MFKLRKKTKDSSEFSAPLTLYAAGGSLQHSFDPEIIDSLRRMTTELAYTDGLPRRLAVISALRGEGVTYTTLALATTLASDTADQVCVVDLNWWSPGIVASLDPALRAAAQGGRKRKKAPPAEPAATAQRSLPGVAQVVLGKAELDAAIITTRLPNLSLLPAGELPLEQRPVIARSTGLRALIDQLASRYTYLLLDVPAILTTSDSIALASLADACCMVVRHGVTATPSVQRALDDVRHLKQLGIILNQVSIKTPRWLRTLIPQE